MEIGISLTTARKRVGLTVAQVAARSGVPTKTVWRLEKSDLRWVTLRQLLKVARVVNCRVAIVTIGGVLSPASRRNKVADEF